MKTIKQQVSLEGQTQTITISEFRKQPGDILAQVELGMRFVITRGGKEIADLVPHEMNAFELGRAARGPNWKPFIPA
jgi:prevent-host-death family protein